MRASARTNDIEAPNTPAALRDYGLAWYAGLMTIDDDLAAWIAGLDDLFALVAGRFFRVEPRLRARAYVRGLLAPLAAKNGWTLAEAAGDATPDGMQRLLNRATWDDGGVRDDVRAYVVRHLGAADGRQTPGSGPQAVSDAGHLEAADPVADRLGRGRRNAGAGAAPPRHGRKDPSLHPRRALDLAALLRRNPAGC